jgi:indole-3-glycerol phosphate synthase
MIGVNNRDLKTFEVSLDFSKQLAWLRRIVKISESGISTIEAITELKPYGYQVSLLAKTS